MVQNLRRGNKVWFKTGKNLRKGKLLSIAKVGKKKYGVKSTIGKPKLYWVTSNNIRKRWAK